MSGQDHTVSLGQADNESRTLAALSLALAAGRSLADVEIDLTDPEQCRFGAYTLVERIGAGGMGLVYRAHQLSLERDVAIKILNMEFSADSEALARFHFEAKSAAALNHPNIVQILEIGDVDGIAFIAMQLVRGETLADRIQRERPNIPAAVALMLKLCDAVGYAHRLQLLHLDLKPANVLINERGEPLVADFGLARHMNPKGQVEAQEVSGTPGYMAPEQVLIKEFRLSVGTDIYALGAILYEMLCGLPPHGRGSAADVMRRALAGQIPSPRSLNSSVPKDLEAIMLKCLSLRQQDRYASVEVLADDLRRFANALPVSVRRPILRERVQRWYAREPKFAFAMALILLLALAGGAVFAQLYRQADFERAGAEGLARLLMAQSDDDDRPILQRLHSQMDGSSAWVPLVDCHEFNVNCGRGLNPQTNINGNMTQAQSERLIASLRAYVPRIRVWGNTRLSLQLAEKVRQLDLSIHEADRARAAAATDTADGYLFAYLSMRNDVADPRDKDDRRTWFRRALVKTDRAWQVEALAQACDPLDGDCQQAIRRFRELAPDNAAAWLVGLGPTPSPTGDAQIQRAAAAPMIDNGQLPLIDAAESFAQRLMPTLEPGWRISPETFALDVWGDTESFAFPYEYCRRSFVERDAPPAREACRAVAARFATIANPTVVDEMMAASMTLHTSDNPAAQTAAWRRYRNARWILSSLEQLPADPDGNTIHPQYEQMRARGELAAFRYWVARANLPLEAPEEFVTRKPLPWPRYTAPSANPGK